MNHIEYRRPHHTDADEKRKLVVCLPYVTGLSDQLRRTLPFSNSLFSASSKLYKTPPTPPSQGKGTAPSGNEGGGGCRQGSVQRVRANIHKRNRKQTGHANERIQGRRRKTTHSTSFQNRTRTQSILMAPSRSGKSIAGNNASVSGYLRSRVTVPP